MLYAKKFFKKQFNFNKFYKTTNGAKVLFK